MQEKNQIKNIADSEDSFTSLRAKNARYIKGKKPFIHKGGDGLTAHVLEKYG